MIKGGMGPLFFAGQRSVLVYFHVTLFLRSLRKGVFMQVPHAFPSYSIKSFETARNFYEKVLGLKVKEIPMGECKFLELELPDMRVLLYEKKDHTPATFTVLNFEVYDIGSAVKELSKKGVSFEHYEGTDELGITHDGGPDIAWFKDPDGNFLSVIQKDEAGQRAANSEYKGDAPPSPS
jgi:predicted enzyme related to lactoylglutathione lyase